MHAMNFLLQKFSCPKVCLICGPQEGEGDQKSLLGESKNVSKKDFIVVCDKGENWVQCAQLSNYKIEKKNTTPQRSYSDNDTTVHSN